MFIAQCYTYVNSTALLSDISILIVFVSTPSLAVKAVYFYAFFRGGYFQSPNNDFESDEKVFNSEHNLKLASASQQDVSCS
jgi:hypothetical protein